MKPLVLQALEAYEAEKTAAVSPHGQVNPVNAVPTAMQQAKRTFSRQPMEPQPDKPRNMPAPSGEQPAPQAPPPDQRRQQAQIQGIQSIRQQAASAQTQQGQPFDMASKYRTSGPAKVAEDKFFNSFLNYMKSDG